MVVKVELVVVVTLQHLGVNQLKVTKLVRKINKVINTLFVEEMKKYTEDTYSGEWASGSTEAAAARIIAASVQPRHILLPIPNIELGVNEALRQNPLW